MAEFCNPAYMGAISVDMGMPQCCQFFFYVFFSTLNDVIHYKMQFNIWPTFSKGKGSIVNSRHIGNKVTHFQTTLGAGTYAF